MRSVELFRKFPAPQRFMVFRRKQDAKKREKGAYLISARSTVAITTIDPEGEGEKGEADVPVVHDLKVLRCRN